MSCPPRRATPLSVVAASTGARNRTDPRSPHRAAAVDTVPAFDPAVFGGDPQTPPVPTAICWDELYPAGYAPCATLPTGSIGSAAPTASPIRSSRRTGSPTPASGKTSDTCGPDGQHELARREAGVDAARRRVAEAATTVNAGDANGVDSAAAREGRLAAFEILFPATLAADRAAQP